MRVIDDQQQWRLTRARSHQRQHRAAYCESIRGAICEPERRIERRSLWVVEFYASVMERPEKARKRRIRQQELRLHAVRPHRPYIESALHQLVEKRRLPDPRLTAYDDCAAP